jgi:hypothetical protein
MAAGRESHEDSSEDGVGKKAKLSELEDRIGGFAFLPSGIIGCARVEMS